MTGADRKRLYRVGLLKLCEQLHMSLTGSSDPLPRSERELVVAYLRERLDMWNSSHQKCEAYDATVRILVIVALAEESRERAVVS